MKTKLNTLIQFFKGKKTNIVGVAGFIYGAYAQNAEIIIISLGLLGLSDRISPEFVDAILDLYTQRTKKKVGR